MGIFHAGGWCVWRLCPDGNWLAEAGTMSRIRSDALFEFDIHQSHLNAYDKGHRLGELRCVKSVIVPIDTEDLRK